MARRNTGEWDPGTRREALAYVDALHGLAVSLTGSATDAEDLVQETYARAFAAAARFEPGTNLKAWLFRILRNTFVDGYRRQRASPIDPTAADLEPPPHPPVVAGGAMDTVAPGDIEAAMMSLSEESRSVILLDLEGLTEVESASVLGCAVGTIKSRLARARAVLRERLADYAR